MRIDSVHDDVVGEHEPTGDQRLSMLHRLVLDDVPTIRTYLPNTRISFHFRYALSSYTKATTVQRTHTDIRIALRIEHADPNGRSRRRRRDLADLLQRRRFRRELIIRVRDLQFRQDFIEQKLDVLEAVRAAIRIQQTPRTAAPMASEGGGRGGQFPGQADSGVVAVGIVVYVTSRT